MADLTESQSSLPVKIIGSDATGAETNFVAVDSSGNLNVNINTQLPTGANNIGSANVAATGTLVTPLSDGAGGVGLGVSLIATNFVLSTGNSSTTQLASGATYVGTIENIYNQQAISILLTTDQIGTINIIQYIDAAGLRKSSTFTYTVLPNSPFSKSFVANGSYFNVTFKNTGLATTTTFNVNIKYGTLPASTNAGNHPMSLDEVSGTLMGARPDGFLRTQIDPTTLLFDTFETLNTVDVWTLGGTVLPTAANGTLSVSPGTAANASSYATSKATFTPGSNAFLQYANLSQFETTVTTGNQRFFGLGVITTPTIPAPVTNGVLYEIDSTTGALRGSVYSNSTRTQSIALIRPTDGNIHRYAMYYKASRVYFEIDNINVGSIAFPNPQVAALATVIGSINGASVLASAAVLNASLIGCADTGRNSTQISDGKFNWRKATVNLDGSFNVSGSVASGSTDSGNPVKIGGIYNAVLPSVSTGSRVDLQLDASGRLLTSSVSLPTAASKFSFGLVSTAAATQVGVLSTTYVEQTTNSAMTMVSSSTSDIAGGTGARTVVVTYLDQTMAGPFTTSFILNGTTAVTASVSNMCFIEKITVTTVGSTLSNVGTLTLKAGATTVGSVAPTNNLTWWAQHYVPAGKICYISGFNIGNTSSAAGGGGVFVLKSATPAVANTPEIQVSDFVNMPGAAPSVTRNYASPIQVVGPARIRAYVTPNATSAYNSFCSFDYIDN